MHTASHNTRPAGHTASTGPVLIGHLAVSGGTFAGPRWVQARLQARWMQEELQEGGDSVRRLCLRWDVVGDAPGREL